MNARSVSVEMHALDEMREAICSLGLRRAENGDVIISRSGNEQKWLLDLRPIFLHRPAVEKIADAFLAYYANFGSLQTGALETAAIPMLAAPLLRAPQGRIVNGFVVRKIASNMG